MSLICFVSSCTGGTTGALAAGRRSGAAGRSGVALVVMRFSVALSATIGANGVAVLKLD
jgi:hypothetical protein